MKVFRINRNRIVQITVALALCFGLYFLLDLNPTIRNPTISKEQMDYIGGARLKGDEIQKLIGNPVTSSNSSFNGNTIWIYFATPEFEDIVKARRPYWKVEFTPRGDLEVIVGPMW